MSGPMARRVHPGWGAQPGHSMASIEADPRSHAVLLRQTSHEAQRDRGRMELTTNQVELPRRERPAQHLDGI
jgi:hypothetical protein